jgi:hypothetical protein
MGTFQLIEVKSPAAVGERRSYLSGLITPSTRGDWASHSQDK